MKTLIIAVALVALFAAVINAAGFLHLTVRAAAGGLLV